MDMRTILLIALVCAVKHTFSIKINVTPKEGIVQMNSDLAFTAQISDLPPGKAQYIQLIWNRNYATHALPIWTAISRPKPPKPGQPGTNDVTDRPDAAYEGRLRGAPANQMGDISKSYTLMFIQVQSFDDGNYHVELKYQHEDVVTIRRSANFTLVVSIAPRPFVVFIQNGKILEDPVATSGEDLEIQCRSYSAKPGVFDLTLFKDDKELKYCSPRREKNSCEPGWYYYKGSCYLPKSMKADFVTAQTACKRMKASLVSIADEHENHYIKHLSTMNSIEIGWLGLQKKKTTCSNALLRCRQSQWEWEDGTKYQANMWVNWKKAEPQKDDLCALLSHESWVGTECHGEYSYFCEKVQCKKDWIYRDNSCYLPVKNKTTFLTANTDCKAQGATLVTISDKEENTYVKRLQQDHGLESLWTGLMKLGAECDTQEHSDTLECRRNGWQWSDDTVYDPAGYSDWESNEEPTEHDICIRLTHGTPAWKGADCGDTYDYICEQSTCEPGWDLYNGRCYYFGGEDKKVSYHNAKNACAGLKATLMTIGEEKENNFTKKEQKEKKVNFAWMGLTKEKNTCTESEQSEQASQACRMSGWRWNDETPYDPKKWNDWGATAEPQKEDVCVSMVLAHNGWDGNQPDDCIQPQKYICEKEGNDHICSSTLNVDSSIHGAAFWCQAKWQEQNYDSTKVLLDTNRTALSDVSSKHTGLSKGGIAGIIITMMVLIAATVSIGLLAHYNKLNKPGMMGLKDQAMEQGRKAVAEVRTGIDKMGAMHRDLDNLGMIKPTASQMEEVRTRIDKIRMKDDELGVINPSDSQMTM